MNVSEYNVHAENYSNYINTSPFLATKTGEIINNVENYQRLISTMVYSDITMAAASTSTSLVVTVESSNLEPFTQVSTSEMVEMIYQMILFAVGTPINVIALIKFSQSSKTSSSEMRLMRLSRQLLIAHLLVLCIYCVWRTYWFYNITWTQGNILCKIYSFLTALSFHLWSNIVAAIAADMLYCIALPLNSVHNGNKRVSWLIAISWATALTCSAPMILFRGTVKIPNTDFEQCYPLVQDFDNSALLTFHVFHVLTTFYLPLCVIVVCYICIGLTLRVRMAERRILGEDRKKCHNVNTKFLLGTVCIVCTFILTWLPYQAMALIRVICAPNSKCDLFVSKLTWLQAILITSTCINPFLYKFGIFQKNRRHVGSNYTTHSQIVGISYADSIATVRHQDGKEQCIRSKGVLYSSICRQQFSVQHNSNKKNNLKNKINFTTDSKRCNNTEIPTISLSQPLLNRK